MAFGDNLFQAGSQSVPVQAPSQPPVEVRVGDDWIIVCNLTDNLGRALALGQATIGAVFYPAVGVPSTIAGQNGSVSVVDAANGVVSVVVSSGLTENTVPTSLLSPHLSFLSIFMVDSLGHRHTFPPQSLLVLRPQDPAPIPTAPQLQFVTFVQGPAGASNTYTAGQIEALTSAAQAAAIENSETYTDQQIAALPPAGISEGIAQGLIRAALVAYATQQNVSDAVSQATVGLVTASEVQAQIQAFFAGQTFAPTGATLAALIDARIVTYLQQNSNLIGGVLALGMPVGAVSFSVDLAGVAQASSVANAAADIRLNLAGTAQSASVITGSLSGSAPLAASANAAANAIGSATIQMPGALALSGIAAASSQVSGTAGLGINLSSSVSAGATPQGAAALAISISGNALAGAAIAATPSRSSILMGTASALSIASGSVSFTDAIGGLSNAGATVLAFLSRDRMLAGAAASSASARAGLTKTNTSPLFAFGFLGASSAPSGSPIYTGNATAPASIGGLPTLSTPVAGAVSSAALVSGTLGRSQILVGNAPASAIATGALTSANSNVRSPLFAFGLLGAAA